MGHVVCTIWPIFIRSYVLLIKTGFITDYVKCR